jgi:hypothetical protein
MMEEQLLTTEEKKYLERVGRYIQSMGEKYVELEIEANDYDSKTEISDIEWDHVTHFDWGGRLDIPSGFITILQKIFNYIDQSGRYSFPDIEGVNYNRFSVEINTTNRELTVIQQFSYFAEGSEDYMEYEDPELMEEWKDQLETNGVEIPETGILTISYNGGGDDGALENSFDEVSHGVPADMEDFCYKELSSNYGGWENNEGGYGRFEFNFKNGTVYLFHVQNYEEQESNTLFEVEY